MMIFFFFSSSLNSLRRKRAVLAYILHTHTRSYTGEEHTHIMLRRNTFTRIYGIHAQNGFDSDTYVYWMMGVREGRQIGRYKRMRIGVSVKQHRRSLWPATASHHRQGMAAILYELLCFGACTLVYRLAWYLLVTQPFAHVTAAWEVSMDQPGSNRKSATQLARICLTAELSSIFEHFFLLIYLR